MAQVKFIPDNDLQVTGDLTVDGNIAPNTASAHPITTTTLTTDNMEILGTAMDELTSNGNVIQTSILNSDLELRASGTGLDGCRK